MVSIIARWGTLFIASIHGLLAIMEIFMAPMALERSFGMSPEVAQEAAKIAQNAGIYNSFIAAGLVWATFATKERQALRFFFLICVIIAGIFGAFTLKWTTLVIQTLPAVIVLFCVVNDPN